MTDSLRDQLLSLGFKPAPAPERKPGGNRPGGDKGHRAGKGGLDRAGAGKASGQRQKPGAGGKGGRPGGSRRDDGEMDLGKAWALRAQQEKQERIEAERRQQEEARLGPGGRAPGGGRCWREGPPTPPPRRSPAISSTAARSSAST